MKTNFLLYTFLVCFSSAFAQQINWAKNISTYLPAKGVFTDNTGNIYNYGSSFTPDYTNLVFNVSTGSYFHKYDPNGTLLFSKNWGTGFCIQKIIYDGAGYGYFTGIFTGIATVDGITITSKGAADGMIGKMDMSGTVLWLTTFGGSSNDLSNTITFNASKTNVIVTGGISDSLFVNHSFVDQKNEKSLFIAGFDLSGTFQSHKLVNFTPNRNNASCGMELFTDAGGNYILHAYREGKYWSNDTINSADEGEYIYKLDNAYNILWSTFIINHGCYYGYTCGGLGISGSGNAYIPSFCSGKYGGDPSVKCLSSQNGTQAWISPLNPDGNYSFAYGSGNNVYLLGVEGQNGCPCEQNHRGYNVIKKFDGNHQLLGEVRINHVLLTGMTKSNTGALYVTGYSYQGALVGNDSVKGNFMISLNDVNCSPVALDTLSYYWDPKVFCDTLRLDAGAGYQDYLWSNGSTNRVLKTTQEGWYHVKVTEANGCMAWSMGSNSVKRAAPPVTQVYYVSYDNDIKKNKVFWNPDIHHSGSFARIIKKSNSGVIVIDTVQNSNYNMSCVDSLNWSDTSQVSYSIIMEDYCGNESAASGQHKTMFLQYTKQNNAAVLQWTKYEGFIYPGFQVLRGTGPANLKVIATLNNAQLTYTDHSFSPGCYYQVRILKYGNYILSNMVHEPVMVLAKENFSRHSEYSVYPNPSENEFYLKTTLTESQALNISIFDLQGRLVYKEAFTAPTGPITHKIGFNAEPGVYFMEVSGSRNKEVTRIIKK